jgi:hypothetical protein
MEIFPKQAYYHPVRSQVRQEDEPMALLTVEGTYKDGRIELTERPNGVGGETRVLVTFLTSTGSDAKPAVEATEDRETLRQRAFAQMKEGIHLGGPPYPKREELYDRFDK